VKPPFQLAVAVSQPAATQTGPAATVAILPPVQTAAGTYRHLRRRFEMATEIQPLFQTGFVASSANVESGYLFSENCQKLNI
jgi:hypothetical protein